MVGEGGGAQDGDWSGAECFRLLGSSTSSTELNLKFSVFFLFSHTLTAESAPLALSFLGHSAACVGPISNTHPPTRGNMVFGLCRGAWPYKGLCTAGGKLAAEALRVLKKEHSARGRAQDEAGAPPPYPKLRRLGGVAGEGRAVGGFQPFQL